MKEISYKDMKFNPFHLIGDEWMLVTAGDENSCNTMTASWGHLGCLNTGGQSLCATSDAYLLRQERRLPAGAALI